MSVYEPFAAIYDRWAADMTEDVPFYVSLAHTIRYAVGDNRLDITLASGDTISIWWATKNEWLGLIEVAGLELEALYGDFDRTPLADESREYVFVTRKP
jgi:hypothetical protein